MLIVFDIDSTIVDPGRGMAVDHRQPPGVLEVIRWFQLQPSTYVGLITGRPERCRAETLRSLNVLGRRLGVEFDSELLQMNGRDDEGELVAWRAEALRAFPRARYRTVAVVDAHPGDRVSVEADESGEILFLRAGGGHDFDLRDLVREADVPDGVQLAWHGINDEINLREFLGSRVRWGECDVRRDPGDRIVVRHDSYAATPATHDERPLALAAVLDAFAVHDRSVKLDLKEGAGIIDEVVTLLGDRGFDGERVWFNGRIEVVGAKGFAAVRRRYPDAVVQCPVDFLAAVASVAPPRARSFLGMLAGWGITRVSVGGARSTPAPCWNGSRTGVTQ